MSSFKRWSATSQEAKLLESKLKAGEIDPNEQPRDIYKRYSVFQKYKLDSFRAAYNKMKAKLGLRVQRGGK